MNHPNLSHWYALKDAVRGRCANRCEYCALREGSQLHHRHYATFGREGERDVMLLCRDCHAVIHRKAPRMMMRAGSLADRGDSGRGISPAWIGYLNATREGARA